MFLFHQDAQKYKEMARHKSLTKFFENVNGTALLGCNNECYKLRPKLNYFSRDLWRMYWNNPSFLRKISKYETIVLQTNRNVVSYVDKYENRRILQSMIRTNTPLYENCLHHRSLRTTLSLNTLVSCASRDPIVVFSDMTSKHLSDVDKKKRKVATVVRANDTDSLLKLARCKYYWIPGSSFSIAAALLSTTPYQNILVYDNKNCSKVRPLLHTRSMFFPP